jgi:hypothetical protein
VRFDHVAVLCDRLEEGVAQVEAALGVTLAPGGRHPEFGTHNRLLSLGRDAYLEVIAPDPGAAPPARRRWFGLDDGIGRPRPGAWVARVAELDAAPAPGPEPVGAPVRLARGPYRWRMEVPVDGRLPWDGTWPAPIAWEGHAHPAPDLPDAGCRLAALEIFHPRAGALAGALGPVTMPRGAAMTVAEGPPGLAVQIRTPHGVRRLA